MLALRLSTSALVDAAVTLAAAPQRVNDDAAGDSQP